MGAPNQPNGNCRCQNTKIIGRFNYCEDCNKLKCHMCNNLVEEKYGGKIFYCWFGFVNCIFWYPYVFRIKDGLRKKSFIGLIFPLILIWVYLCLPMYLLYFLGLYFYISFVEITSFFKYNARCNIYNELYKFVKTTHVFCGSFVRIFSYVNH